MPKVSVIVPNYNHASFLKQRIDSVLQQTFQDFELILLDDYSKDNSREIIEQYRDHSKVSNIVYNEINSGSTFKQWEKGIGLAKGDYIWIAESDDYCETILLETLMTGVQNNPCCTVSYCQSYYIDHKGTILNLPRPQQLEKCMDGIDFVNKYLIYHSVIYNASMTLFKKETYFTISNDYTAFRFCGDWVFWSEMASRGDVFMSGKLLNYFRFHNGDVSGKMYTTGKSYVEQFKCLLLLRKKFTVNDEIYKKALSYYTTRFFVEKKHFSTEIKDSVKRLLNEKENKKHSFYLWAKWLQNRLGRVFQKLYEIIDGGKT